MRIISTTPGSNGAYPPIQEWPGHKAPDGFAVWPDSLDTEDFDTYNGFVVLTVLRGRVASYEVNHEAWEAWTPAPEPEPPTLGGSDAIYDELAAAIREGVDAV